MLKKKCIKCNKVKSLDEFYKNRNRTTSMCKVCTKENNKKYRKDPVVKKREQERIKEKMWIKYGIKNMTIKKYEVIKEEQNNCCKICGTNEIELKIQLCVDHNHKTGQVRGLLCDKCNNLLGKVKDNINILELAIDYLQKASKNAYF